MIEDVEDYGKIVGGKVPGHIDVLLIESQVAPAGTDVEEFAEIPEIDDLFDLHDR